MADKIVTTSELRILVGFVDEDDRTISIPNPSPNLTEQQVKAVETYAAPVLIGDKYQAAFSRFKSARYVEVTRKTFDLQ